MTTAYPLPFVAINGDTFSLLGAFVRPFWLGGNGSVGLLELAQTIFMDIAPGEAIIFARELVVGNRNDVASVTDQLWTDAPLVRGDVEAGARIHVSRLDGTPVTEVRPAASGAFAFRLAPGRYTLRVPAPAGRQIERDVEVLEADVDLGTLRLPAAATVELPRGRPMRLVFLPADGKPVH